MNHEKKMCPTTCMRGATFCDSGFGCERSKPEKKSTPLFYDTLQRLRIANPQRCVAFGHTVDDMPLLFWSTAVAGETGELCNLIKKHKRGDNIPGIHEKIGDEAADIVIYLDLLCTKLGLNLEEFIVKKFNEVSDRVKSPIKL